MGTRFATKANGKVDKPPYRTRAGQKVVQAGKTDPESWATWEEACSALSDGVVDAIGYVFTEDVGLVIIDLDDVRNPVSGEIDPWAWEVVQNLDTYTEISCSGRGLHLIAEGTKRRSNRCRIGSVEAYDHNRFVVVTGNRLDGTPKEPQPRQAQIDDFLAKHLPEQTRQKSRYRARPPDQ